MKSATNFHFNEPLYGAGVTTVSKVNNGGLHKKGAISYAKNLAPFPRAPNEEQMSEPIH